MMSSAVLHQFYHSFSYHSETFLAHFVARFATERHFVAMYACSEPRTLHTFIAMEPCVLRLAHGPMPRDLIALHVHIHVFLVLKKTGRSWNTNTLLRHTDTWPRFCKNVTTTLLQSRVLQALQASGHTPGLELSSYASYSDYGLVYMLVVALL